MGPASPASQVGEPAELTTPSETPESESYLHDPDVQLMLRTKAGDQAAFAELVTAYQDRLVGIFTHMLRNQELAEDLVQDVFLRVFRARQSYQPTAKFSTWLFRIANNLASNARRSLGRRKEVPLEPSDSGFQPVRSNQQVVADKSGLMPTRQLARQELRHLVQEALATLSERQRMAVLLHKFEGMSYADIGQAMEMSPAAVKSLLSRARENLRSQLEQHMR